MKKNEGGGFDVWCGCGDATIRMVKLLWGDKGAEGAPKKALKTEKEREKVRMEQKAFLAHQLQTANNNDNDNDNDNITITRSGECGREC
jgi:hypothetical protein